MGSGIRPTSSLRRDMVVLVRGDDHLRFCGPDHANLVLVIEIISMSWTKIGLVRNLQHCPFHSVGTDRECIIHLYCDGFRNWKINLQLEPIPPPGMPKLGSLGLLQQPWAT